MLTLWIRKYFIWISMTSTIIEGHKSSSNFSVNPTLPLLNGSLLLPPLNCVDLSLYLSLTIHLTLHLSSSYSHSIFLSISLFCSMQTLFYTQRNVFHIMKYDLKGHMRSHDLKEIQISRSFDQITTLTYVLMDNFCPCSKYYKTNHKLNFYLWCRQSWDTVVLSR